MKNPDEVSTEEPNKNSNSYRTIRAIWIMLMVVFAALVVYRLYEWSQGRDSLRGILSPFGMIFVGAGAIIRPYNRQLSYIFTGIALILVLSGLILMLVY